MTPKHQRVHEKRLRRKAKQAIKRHQTFVKEHGPIETRWAKNMIKYPSLAGPDKRPSIRGLVPEVVTELKTPIVELVVTEQNVPIVDLPLSQ
jgi:hypothetical protein